MRTFLIMVSCLFTLLLAGTYAHSQVTISGASCVVTGTLYQYTISRGPDSSTTMQACVTGGIITDSAKNKVTCTLPGVPINKILVIWTGTASGTGSLSLNFSSGNTVLNVHFTEPLLPGSINSSSKSQMISYDSLPTLIVCSPDMGGSCSPAYINQWQQSQDVISWIDIPGAGEQSLAITSLLEKSTYYRRKVTETSSGTIGYSDVASVFLMLQLTDTTVIQSRDSSDGSSGLRFFNRYKVLEYYSFAFKNQIQKARIKRQKDIITKEW